MIIQIYFRELTGFQWLTKEQLEKQLVEVITEKEYENFVTVMERLCTHPFSYKAKDFIQKYRTPLLSQTVTLEVPKPSYDQDGRAYVTTYGNYFRDDLILYLIGEFLECLRKRARAHVTIKSPGTGIVTINDKDITYFEDKQPREQVST